MEFELNTVYLGSKGNSIYTNPLGKYNLLASSFENNNRAPYIIFIWNANSQIIGFVYYNFSPNIKQISISLFNNSPPIVINDPIVGAQAYYFSDSAINPITVSSNGLSIKINTTDSSGNIVTNTQIITPPKTSSTSVITLPNETPSLSITPSSGYINQTFTITGNAWNNTDNIDVYINGSYWDSYPGTFTIKYATSEPMTLTVEAVDTINNLSVFASATIKNTTNTPFLKDYTIYQNQLFEVKTVAWNLEDSVGLYIQGGTQFPNETLLIKGNGIAQYTFNTGNNIFLNTGTYTIYAEDFNNNQTTPMYQITVVSSPTASTDPPSLTLTNGNVLTATAYSGDTVEIIQGSTVLASGTTTATYTVTGGETAYTSFQAKDTTNSTLSAPIVAIMPATINTNEWMNGNATLTNVIILANILMSPFMNGNSTISNQTPILANITENTFMNTNSTISNQTPILANITENTFMNGSATISVQSIS